MVYLNPTYYGFSAMTYLLLEDYNDGCNGTELDCYPNSGAFLLRHFSFEHINPYLHIVVSVIITES